MSNQELIPYPKDALLESDLSLARTLQRWAETELMAKRLEHQEDYDKLLKPAMHKLLVEVELQKMLFPEEHGGIGLNTPQAARTVALALEQIGRGDTGIGYVTGITLALCSTFTMQDSYNEDLCRRIAPLFCAADEVTLGSLIMPLYTREEAVEPSSLFRGKKLQAQAVRDRDEWVITGKNLRPLNSGADAKLFGVLCALEGEGEGQPGLILIPGDAPGLSREEPFLKTGLAASVNGEVNLTEIRVPLGNLAFQGEEPYRRMLSYLYLTYGATAVGSLFAAYEIIKEWGDTRVIKGKGSIFKENPLTASLMAEIGHEIIISRLLVHQLAPMLSNPELYRQSGEEALFIPALSVASHVTQSAEKAINQAMELMGSAGYATEWNLERYWRDVKTMQVHLGNWELNKMELARYLYRCQTL